MFEELFDIAKTKLAGIGEKLIGLPGPQVTILFTDRNNYYAAVNDIDGSICEELKNKNDTKIVNMLTMWKSGYIDIASFEFLKALVDLDNSNSDTIVYLQGKDSYLSKKLSEVIY